MTVQIQQKEINAEAILDTIRSLNQLKGLDMILDHTLRAARTMANAEAGSIYLFKDNTLLFSHVQNDTIFGKQGAGAQRYSDLSIPVTSDTIVGYSALTKQVIVTDDAYGIPATLPYHFNAFFDKENNYRSVSILT
ncbi:MAG: GAF domain-containing protein, partial [Thermodesulfobacteriota bacterium]